MEAIKRRILSHGVPQRIPQPEPPTTKKIRCKGNIHFARRITSFRALYVRYFYLLGGKSQRQIQGQRPPTAKQILFIFREDIRKMHDLSNEMKLLGRNRIDTAEQLSSYRDSVTARIVELTDERRNLRNKTRSSKDEPTVTALKAEVADLSAQLGAMRREVKLCDSISARTAVMREKIRLVAEIRAKEQQSKLQDREGNDHEQWRGRR